MVSSCAGEPGKPSDPSKCHGKNMHSYRARFLGRFGRVGKVRALTRETHAKAVILARDDQLSFYDALIVAAALEAGCDTLLTEDMQHGRVIQGLTISNPLLRPSN